MSRGKWDFASVKDCPRQSSFVMPKEKEFAYRENEMNKTSVNNEVRK